MYPQSLTLRRCTRSNSIEHVIYAACLGIHSVDVPVDVLEAGHVNVREGVVREGSGEGSSGAGGVLGGGKAGVVGGSGSRQGGRGGKHGSGGLGKKKLTSLLKDLFICVIEVKM